MRVTDTSGPGSIAARTAVTAAAPVASVARAKEAASPGSEVALSADLAGHAVPVDSERVNRVRLAIENGSYAITPGRIADAMISAQFLLRIPS